MFDLTSATNFLAVANSIPPAGKLSHISFASIDASTSFHRRSTFSEIKKNQNRQNENDRPGRQKDFVEEKLHLSQERPRERLNFETIGNLLRSLFFLFLFALERKLISSSRSAQTEFQARCFFLIVRVSCRRRQLTNEVK